MIGLIQLQLENDERQELSIDELGRLYDAQILSTKNLMMEKNHDYGEAWREMQQETFADMILARLQRIRQILSNDGKTIMSEGIDANLMDIINYSVFALILISEGIHHS